MKKIKRVITALFAFTFLIYCSIFRVSAIVLRQNEDFCLLVLGVDDMWSNTDTIMLVKVDSTAEKINVLSIPRDTMVCYDGRICKINSVFAKCISMGMSKNDSTEAVKSFVNDALGVTIDFSVVLDSYAFISIVDAMQGVDIILDQDLVIDMSGGEALSLGRGENKLSGREALYFVRHRKSYLNGDLGRIRAQAVFARAFLKKLSRLDIFSALKVYKTVLDTVVIDASPHTVSFVDSIVKSLIYRDVSFCVLPGEPIILNQVSYYKINRSEADRMITIFGGSVLPNNVYFIC